MIASSFLTECLWLSRLYNYRDRVWPRPVVKISYCHSLNPENGNPRRSAFPECFSVTICDKIVYCPVPSLEKMCVKGDSIDFFFSSAINCSFLSYARSMMCVSCSEKTRKEKQESSRLWTGLRQTERRSVGGGGGRGCVSVFEWKSQTRSLSQDRLTGPASLMIIKLHISAKKRQSSLPWLCPRPVCPQEETDESWTLLFYCKMTHSKVQ